jgi:hypothetical protein
MAEAGKDLQKHMTHTLQILIILIVGLMVGWCPVWVAAEASPSVSYSRQWIARTRVHVVTVNLLDRSLLVTPRLAANSPGRRQSFVGFLAQHQPLAQITGSYFSLRNSLPIGDIVVEGRRRFQGPVGSALVITPQNRAAILNIPYGWRSAWLGYETVLQGGVRLVQNGKYAVYPRQQGFRDPGLFRRATRTAIGLRADQRLLLVAVNKEVLLSELAAIMKALGSLDAMTLDGGTSTGLSVGSELILTPGRTLSNVLMVLERPTPIPLPAAAAPPEPAKSSTSSSVAKPTQLRYSNTRSPGKLTRPPTAQSGPQLHPRRNSGSRARSRSWWPRKPR